MEIIDISILTRNTTLFMPTRRGVIKTGNVMELVNFTIIQ